MGATLPKPLLTKVEERKGNALFRVGSSCMNGYRENMEDAHLIHLCDSWGFFAVFDGHVNDKCSAYLEDAFREHLEKHPGPKTDEEMREMALKIDKEWLERGEEGGSTGTFFLASREGAIINLQVGNVGDSRVLVCKNGECIAMTEDHKPNNEEERRRIESFGGHVENNRVDGSLAISRAFGDRDYKQSTNDQLKQKVIALADVSRTTVPDQGNDFAVLCCDGVFEGEFSNNEVVSFIKGHLEKNDDIATIASLVCEEAINRGSRDNISCMIVQFKDGSDFTLKPTLSCVPGPFNAPNNTTFMKMYKEMASKGGMSIGKALEIRYDTAKANNTLTEEEKNFFGEVPKDKRGDDRTDWFGKKYEDASKNAKPENGLSRLTALQHQVGLPLPVLMALMNDMDGNA